MDAWYLLYCKRGQQSRATQHLELQDIRYFCPMLTVKKQRRGQWQEEAEALFANYLFVHFNPDQLSVTRVQATRGVARLVRFGETLARVPDEVLIDLARRYNPLVALPEEGKVCSQPMCTALQQALMDIERESNGEVRALRFLQLLQDHRLLASRHRVE